MATLLLLVLAVLSAAQEESDPAGERPWMTHLQTIRPRATPDVQAQAVKGLIQRLLPDRACDFDVKVDSSLGPPGKDTFTVKSPGDAATVEIVGTSGVAAASGLLHYLKYSCNAHVSWEADQLDLPDALPAANLKVTSVDRFRYYQNVCTVSYSMAWWGWTRWQREIDWMALNGINLPLAFTGQEAVWHRVYTQMGLTQQELDEHFSGPAFFAWARMGNLRGWGGPLSMSWHNQTIALQKQILGRMREFGMLPVLPGFAGHVPAGMTRLHPTANITRMPTWCNFPDQYSRTYLLDPNDPLFQQIGTAFIREMTSEFGTDHFYNCDTFNEMKPPSSDPAYLKSVGAAIYGGMAQADPSAIWVMQGWIFYNAQYFWQHAQAEALLTSVPIGRLLVLDLASERAPQYNRLESYFGQPFIFNMLHNYGGVDGLFGNVGTLLENLKAAREFPNVTMVGTGITPEGINQNYVMYDFMNEMGWRPSSPNVTQWAADYARRRYGSSDSRLSSAWQYLMRSVYNATTQIDNHGQYVLVLVPRIDRKPDGMWYNMSDVITAWDLLVDVARGDGPDAHEAASPTHEDGEGVGMDPAIPAGQGAIREEDAKAAAAGARRGRRRLERAEAAAGGAAPPELSHAASAEVGGRQRLIGGWGERAPPPRHSLERSRGRQQQPISRVAAPSPAYPPRPSYAGGASGREQGGMGGALSADTPPRAAEEEGAASGTSRGGKVTLQETFRHDMVDFTRQILQVVGGEMVMKMIEQYNNKVLLAVEESHLLVVDLLKDLEELLASSPAFLLGSWLEDASSWGTNQKEVDQYRYNALNQISLWGPSGQIQDYAIKQWSGVVSDYLLPRWDKFGRTLVECLAEGKPFDQQAYGTDIFKTVEQPFTLNTNRTFPAQPRGDSIDIALRLHAKYRPVFDSRLLASFDRRLARSLKRFLKKEVARRKGKKLKRTMWKIWAAEEEEEEEEEEVGMKEVEENKVKKDKRKKRKKDKKRRRKNMTTDSWRENGVKAFVEE